MAQSPPVNRPLLLRVTDSDIWAGERSGTVIIEQAECLFQGLQLQWLSSYGHCHTKDIKTYWLVNWCALPWGKPALQVPPLFSCLEFFCRGVRPHELFPTHLPCLLVMSRFSSGLGSHACETLWVELLKSQRDTGNSLILWL